MSVEIAYWRTRCNECGDVYGDRWSTQEEAQACDSEGHGRCSDCLAELEMAEQLAEGDVVSEECPAGGEHCAHWFDGDRCCFCQLDGPTPVPAVVTVEIPGVSW